MDKFRTAMGILVGILIGLANGLGVKSITVGVIVAVCSVILFAFIFNKVKQKEKCRCASVLFYRDCGHYERLSDRGSERKPDSRIYCTGMPAFVAPGDCSDACLF